MVPVLVEDAIAEPAARSEVAELPSDKASEKRALHHWPSVLVVNPISAFTGLREGRWTGRGFSTGLGVSIARRSIR